MEEMEPYSPWKTPWQKRCALAAAILAPLILWSRISEYQEFSRIGGFVFSPEEVEMYLAQRGVFCLCWGLYAFLVIGSYLIGHFSRSETAFHKCELILLAVATLLWQAGTWVFPFVEKSGLRFLWVAVLLVLLGGDMWLLWKQHGREDDP